ncbi:MAG: LPS export ABC transporter permease LptF [Xanthomonadales bacterium]|nr:LPS export ABC transporter permease LptF [Xanthomonadales bacterium]
MRARIADRYLSREIWSAFSGVAILLVLVTFGGLLTDVLNKVSRGRIPAELVLNQLLLRIPLALSLLLPLAGFVAVMLAFGRLYRDSEMAVLAAAGYGARRQLRVVFNFGLFIAAALLALGLYLVPSAALEAQRQIDEVRQRTPVTGLEAGRFVDLPDGGGVVFLGEYDGEANRFAELILVRDSDGQVEWLASDAGQLIPTELDQPLRFQLAAGERTTVDVEQRRVLRVSYEEAMLTVPRVERQADEEGMDRRSTLALLSDDSRRAQVELDTRLAPAAAAFLLVLMAPLLARSAPRQARYDRIVIAVLLYLAYSNLQGLARTWYELEVTPSALGPHWVHGVLLLLVIAAWLPVWWQARRERRLLSGLRR